MTRILLKFSAYFALSALLAFSFVYPLSVGAQVCNGVCINISTPPAGGGGGASGEKHPSNINVSIEDGTSCTESVNVNLKVEFSNATQIQISNDTDFNDEVWQPISGAFYEDQRRGANEEIIRFTNLDWALEAGDGTRQVYIRLRSAFQNVSRTYSDAITLSEAGCEDIPFVPDTGLQPFDYITSESHPAVYRLSLDLERQPFIHESVYFTYKPDFEGIIVLTDAEQAQIPIGTPMLPNPGTGLVKFLDDPKVYYLDPSQNGDFRWVIDEQVAIANFGTDWQEFLLDVNQSLFNHAVFGEFITSNENFDLSLFIPNLLLSGQKFFNDADSDGLTDYLESQFGTDLLSIDTDGDGLDDGGEYFYQTNPYDSDSDDDGFTDGDEVRDGFNPLGTGVLDSDGDGLDDPEEFFFATDRYVADTDGDGFSDSVEVRHGFDPLGPGLLDRNLSGFDAGRYVLSIFDLAAFKIKSLFPF